VPGSSGGPEGELTSCCPVLESRTVFKRISRAANSRRWRRAILRHFRLAVQPATPPAITPTKPAAMSTAYNGLST
jgi:hypothetical protein